jgi:hypothetical protein
MVVGVSLTTLQWSDVPASCICRDFPFASGRGSPPMLSKILEKHEMYQWKRDFWMYDDNYLLGDS